MLMSTRARAISDLNPLIVSAPILVMTFTRMRRVSDSRGSSSVLVHRLNETRM